MSSSIEQAQDSTPSEAAFTFRPLAAEDFPLLYHWLNNPAVARWWDAPPISVAEIEGKYVPRLDGSEPVFGMIALFSGVPIGFLQWYRLADELEHPAVGIAPEQSAAIDLFIGEDAFRNRGYGSVMIRAFLSSVVFAEPDIVACAIDPCEDNAAAIAAYRKAGFRARAIVPDPREHCDSLVMVLERNHPGM